MAFTANATSASVSTLGGNVTVSGLGSSNIASGATQASFTFTSTVGTFSSINVGAGTAVFTANKNAGSYGTVTATYTVTDDQGATSASGTITITITASGSYTDVNAVAQTAKTSTNVTITSGTPTRANLVALDANVGTITVNTGSALDLTGTAAELTSIVGAVTFSNKINGTVNDASGLTYSTLNTLLNLGEVRALTVSNQTEYNETASNANSLVALSAASETANKILFKANSQITSTDTSFSHTIINAIFTDTGGKFTKVILNNDTTLSGALTIPASHTLEVKSSKTLTLGAVLSNSGTLTNGGTVKFNANGGLTATGATTLGGTVTINGDSTLTATGTLAITNAFNVGGNTLTLAGAGALSGGAIQLNNGSSVVKKTGTGSIANAVTLSSADAKLDIDANTSISGNITMSANATFDIGSNTLTYSGAAIDVGSNTLTLTGSGTITNSNDINLSATASLIKFAGATVAKLKQSADAASGKGIDVSTGASTITTLTHNGQSRIKLGANLAITNAFNVGAKTMILSGTSTLSGGKITLNNASSLIQVTAGCTISSDIAFTADSGSGKGLDINSGCTISGDLTTSADAIIDVASGQTLTYSGAAFAVAANTLNILGGGTIANSNAITFTSGELDVDANNTISGAITISGDATFDIGTNTLTYSGAAIDVGGNTLTIDGTGTITNSNDIQLNNASSILKLKGSTINKVKQSADAADNKGIDISTNNSTIKTFTSAGQSRIKLGKKLSITNAFNLGAKTMILSGTDTIDGGKITLNNADSLIQVTAGCTIDNDLTFSADSNNNKGLDITETCTISGDITMTSSVKVEVDSGKTLTYSGAAIDIGAKTLDIKGQGTITNSNDIQLNNASSILKLAGATINKVKQSGDAGANKGIEIATNNSTIKTFTSAGQSRIKLDKKLSITNAFNLGAKTMILSGTDTIDGGKITLNNADSLIQVTADCTIDNDLAFSADSNDNKGLDLNDDCTISGDLSTTSDAIIDVASGKTLTYSGAAFAVGAKTLNLVGDGTINNTNAITFSTGTLDVDGDIEIDGNITISGNATLDIANGKTLDYDGASLDVGANTLKLTGGTGATDKGTFDNANAIKISTGKLDVDNNFEIDGDITISGNATIDIANGKTLDYDGASLAIGTKTLTFTGGTGATDKGTFDNANALTISTGQITVTNSVEIDGDITMSGNATISIANGKTLDYDGASLAVGTNTLKLTGGTGATDEGKLDNANAITISTGKLDVDNNIEIDGDITISDDATFDIASGKTLDYDGAQIDIGDNTLSIVGGGTINNDKNITLSHANSLLNIKTDASSTISKVSTSANVTGTNKGIDVDVNATITTLTVSHTCPVLIKNGVTLSGAVSIKAGKVNLTETGTLGADLAFTGGTSATNCTLDVDDNCTMSGDLSVAGTGTVCILDVANGKKLTYSGAAFDLSTYTLRLTGGTGATDEGTLANTNALKFSTGTLDVDNNFEIDGPITISDDAIIDVAANKTLDYDGASIAIAKNTLTIYGSGTIDNANAFTITGGDASAATPTGGEINMKSGAAGADGSGTATIGKITITGTALIAKQLNRITTKTTNGTIGNITATVNDTAANCNTMATDNNDVITVTINDAASTSIAATVLSSIGNKTKQTPTVTNAIVITGTTAQIDAALVTAATKVTASTATISDSTHSTTTITGLQYSTANTRGAAANNSGSTIDTSSLGITNEATRHQIIDRIFGAKSTMTMFRTAATNLNLSNITTTNVDVFKGSGQTVNVETRASNIGIYANLSSKNDSIKFATGTGATKITYTITKTSNSGTVGTNATYSIVGNDNTTVNTTSGNTVKIGNSKNITLIFAGVAINGGNGTVEVTSGGDPYICPCYGPTYKLPDKNAFYRLYENNDIIINGEVKEISEKNKQKLIKYNMERGFCNKDAIIKDIYLFKSIYISVGSHKLAFNLSKINWVTTKHSKDFFTITKPHGVKLESEWFVGGKDGAAKMKVGWMYEGEEMHVNLFFFNDPQKENGISLSGMTSTDSLGLFIRNYNPKTMEIPNLGHMESVVEQFENAKVKFTYKPIKSKNEKWVKY